MKKNNFESKILKNKTIEEEGYDPDVLKPKSNKYIWVVCRYCGKPNRVKKSKFTQSINSNAHMDCRKKELKEIESTFSKDIVKEKIKKTLLEKYGVEHSSKIKSVVEKRKKTFLKKYGVDNPSKSDKIKEKKKNTCIKNYGVDHPLKSSEIKEKVKLTNKKKYCFDYPSQSKEVKNKTKKNFIKKFGKPNPMQNEEIKNKSLKNLLLFINNDKDGRFSFLNYLRSEGNEILEDLKELSLYDISLKYNITYNKLRTAMYDNEDLREYFLKNYSYPKNQIQKKISDYIENKLKVKTICNTRKIISPLELDIYVPDKKFAIEFNGSYWHSELRLDTKEAKYKHLNKTKLCQEKGINLLHIFEHNWFGNEEKYKRYIKNILGLNSNKIMARKCLIDNSNADNLIEENHLQGIAKSTIKYFTLKYNGDIVGTMTANKHHRQNSKNNSIVLGRMVFLPGFNIAGGASKLFKAFKNWSKEEGYNYIISWSDNSYSYGNIYKTLGFNIEKKYNPDYFYFDIKNKCYKSKQSQMKKNNGCPENITEREWCQSNGLYRIWDCGKIKWVYELV